MSDDKRIRRLIEALKALVEQIQIDGSLIHSKACECEICAAMLIADYVLYHEESEAAT